MVDSRIYWALTASLLSVLSITFIAPSIKLRKLKYSYILINLTMFIWNFGYFLLNLYKVGYLLRMIYVGDAFIGPAMILFATVYMRIDENNWIKKYTISAFIIGIILSILVYSKFGFYYSFKRIFIITIFSIMLSSVLIIILWLGKEKNTERKKSFGLLAIIYLIGIMGGITDFLPHNFNVQIFSVGNIAACIMILSFMVLIAKETILPRKEYLADIITYVVTFLLISALYTVIVFSMKNRSNNYILLSIFLASFVAVIMIPIINKLETGIVDKYLVKEKAQLQKFLKDIGNYLIAGIDETDIIGYTIFTLKDLFPQKEFYFIHFLSDFGYMKIYSTLTKEKQDICEISDIDSLEETLQGINNKYALYVDDINNGEIKQYLISKNIQYIFPVKYYAFLGILGISSNRKFLLSNYNEELIKNVTKSMTLSLSNVEIYRSQAEGKKNTEIEAVIRKIGKEYKPFLVNILNDTEYIAMKDYNKNVTIHYIDKIKREVIHLYNLTIDILKYTKMHDHKKKAININEIIGNALNMLYIPTGIKLIKNYGELPKTMGFYEDLLRSFTNILSNSIEAIVNNGKIAITTKYDSINNRIIAVIEDSGSGIDSKIIQNIFSPLFTTREGNTGVGLSITKRVIEKHGGRIQIFSKEGDGTTLRIVLPVM